MNLDADDRLYLRNLVEDAIGAIVFTLQTDGSQQAAMTAFRNMYRERVRTGMTPTTSKRDGG